MRTIENGTERWSGICIEILKALATSLNFKYVYIILQLVDLSECLVRCFVYDIHTFFIIFQMANTLTCECTCAYTPARTSVSSVFLQNV